MSSEVTGGAVRSAAVAGAGVCEGDGCCVGVVGAGTRAVGGNEPVPRLGGGGVNWMMDNQQCGK